MREQVIGVLKKRQIETSRGLMSVALFTEEDSSAIADEIMGLFEGNSACGDDCVSREEYEHALNYIGQLQDEIKEMRAREEIEPLDYIKAKGDIHDRLMACDRKIMDKRKMLLQIEKENLMTIASALRSIPKKQEKPPETDFDRKFGNV